MKKEKVKRIAKTIITDSIKIVVIAIGSLAVAYGLNIADDVKEENEDIIIVEGAEYDVSLKEGDSYQLIPTENDLAYDKITWLTEDDRGLGVTETGIITAKTSGSYTVTCVYQKQNKTEETEEFWIQVTK